MWSLQVHDLKPENFTEQIQHLMSQATQDLSVWKKLGDLYQVDLFCGFFMSKTNQGFVLPKKVMAELSARGIDLGFDIYA
jgi:hypothetical protein